MKKATLILVLIISHLGFSQVTDTGDKVGIGITSPTEKLHVNGNIFANMGEGFKIFGDIDYFGQWKDGIVFQMQDTNATNGSTDGGFVFRGFTPTDNVFKDWMVIKTGGKVGIGTKTPKSLLELNANTTGDAVLRLEADTNNSNEGNNARIEMYQDGGLHGAFVGFSSDWGGSQPDNLFRIGTRSGGTNNYDNITIDAFNGNVGIGTTDTKGFKLGVQGKIAAEEVKVATYSNWADFVFKNNYNLPSLKEVEQHIKEKGHLKDIPSAKEVKENGIFLGEMDSKLLQKIEELTLYTINQEKRIETLESKNEALITLVEKLLENTSEK